MGITIKGKNKMKTKNIVNPYKLVKYQLKSDSSRDVRIPLKHAYRAGKLLNLVLHSGNREEFQNKVSLYPSLNEVYIPGKLNEFIKYYYDSRIYDSDEGKLLDQAYLETCWHMANDDLSKNKVISEGYGEMEGGLERVQKIKNAEDIKSILESLGK